MQEQQSNEEKELFALIAEGDETAFKELFHRYVPQVAPVVTNIIQSEAGVKDVIQDIFMNIWLSRDKLPEIEVVRNWIFKIVYHQSYKWLRQQGVRIRAKERLSEQTPSGLSVNPTEEYADFGETKKLLQQAILDLPPRTRTIYILSREENLKIDEIAHKMGISPQTVKNTLGRALQSIRAVLVGHGIYLPSILLSFFLS